MTSLIQENHKRNTDLLNRRLHDVESPEIIIHSSLSLDDKDTKQVGGKAKTKSHLKIATYFVLWYISNIFYNSKSVEAQKH